MRQCKKSIVTKTGDKGLTFLYKGGKVRKDDVRIEANGELDELGAFLGFAKSCIRSKKIKSIITSVQKDLFIISAEIATKSNSLSKLIKKINSKDVIRLERFIADFESKKAIQKNRFCIFGNNPASAALNVARTISRRAERRLVTLIKKKMVESNYILVYLNRLSDLLFLIAQRYETQCRK